ncbi:MAG: hypothetical protein V4630_06785 [Pseudomonadota bacterium]
MTGVGQRDDVVDEVGRGVDAHVDQKVRGKLAQALHRGLQFDLRVSGGALPPQQPGRQPGQREGLHLGATPALDRAFLFVKLGHFQSVREDLRDGTVGHGHGRFLLQGAALPLRMTKDCHHRPAASVPWGTLACCP